jgi:hypothetical protein
MARGIRHSGIPIPHCPSTCRGFQRMWPERTKRPSGTHKREVQRPVARVLNETSELRPSGLRLNYVP